MGEEEEGERKVGEEEGGERKVGEEEEGERKGRGGREWGRGRAFDGCNCVGASKDPLVCVN